MPRTSIAYRALVRFGVLLAPRLDRSAKAAEGHRGRTGAAGRLAAWAGAARDRGRPLVWFHASSVGEGLQAESVLLELRQLHPEAQYLYTHFSPSAEGLARRLPVDIADYLPYDLPATITPLLTELGPDLLVFAKLDLWPELATRADAAGVTVALVAGTVAPGSGRLRWPARALVRAGYASVAAAGAIADEDAARLARLGVPSERIRVLGDPRFDSVSEKVRAVSPADPLLALGGPATLVAGSTWPRDEGVVLRAFAGARTTLPEARLILAPHEPTEAHLQAVEHAAAALGLPAPVRLGRHRSRAAPPGRSGRRAAEALRRGQPRLRGRGIRTGRPALGARAGGVGSPGELRPTLARESGRGPAALGEGGGRPAGGSGSGVRRSWWTGGAEGWRTGPRTSGAGRRALEVVESGAGAARRSAELLAGLISSRRLRRSPSAAR